MENTTDTGITLARLWAKTNLSGLPALSVRDHCLYVGYVADAVLERMPTHVQRLLPTGIASLVALHDVGKISPGFQRKCDAWRASFETRSLARNWIFAEKKHAAISHAIIGHWLGEELAGYSIAAGGHHGNFCCDHHLPDIGTYARDRDHELADQLFLGPRRT